jgi:tetratricopeptide (TPR) repeat protein
MWRDDARVDAAVQHATELFARHDLEAAERYCGGVIELNPQHAGANHLLGLISLTRGDAQEAILRIQSAVRERQFYPEAHANLGIALRATGALKEAVESFERALSQAPGFVGALVERGSTLLDMGQSQLALDSFAAAVKLAPRNAVALNGCGNAQLELGNSVQALSFFDRALIELPSASWLRSNRATALANLGRAAEGLLESEAALQIDPRNSAAHHTRGDTLQDLNRLAEAVAAYDAAIGLEPSRARVWANRGRALFKLGRCSEAVGSYDRALDLERSGRASGGRANRVAALVNRGAALHQLCRLDEASACYTSAMQLEPDNANAHYNLATALLLSGDLANGWREYEWRWRLPDAEPHRYGSEKLWLGQPLPREATLLLHAEQGLGDTIQFCRYASLAAGLGARVLLEIPQQLTPLLTGLEGVAKILSPSDPSPAFDFHCPLLSLPLAFRTTLDTIPGKVPYLHPDSNKVAYWKERLGPSERLRVGLVWSGGFRPNRPDLWDVNTRRNCPLEHFAILRHPRIEYYSLQKGEPAEAEWSQLESRRWAGPELIDHTPELRDFSDTAALVENLDLVISVDTSTAHLAGALGKPVWILNRFDSCWRWPLGREDTPWYSTARIYRQSSPGDWESVMKKVKSDLISLPRVRF